MKKFDLMTIFGLFLGFVVVLFGMLLGSDLGLFWNLPSVFITVGGSFFAVVIQYDFQQVKGVLSVARQAFSTELTPAEEIISTLAELAKKARKEGLLALEDDMDAINDPLFSKGLQLIVDAIDPDTIRDILETEIDSMAERHEHGQSIFRSWAALAPAFGMIGTLIGLIQMLAHLNDPSKLGPGMSVALLTTFYGAVLANLIMTPIAGKLALRSDEEMRLKTIILEGIIAIQSGLNPRILEEKLKAYIPPKDQERMNNKEKEEEVHLHAAS
ncbi:MAG: motility protein A [Clostridia bacterium]|nr:motility protein A [Clostridia bacterium]